MTHTVFQTTGIDRASNPWDAHLFTLTPWESRSGRLYKREDYFAPLGYGGPNGSKLRQLLHLVKAYVDSGGDQGVLTGASVLSPQLSMAALVARHYGLRSHLVLGGTKPETATRHPNVRIAAAAGSEFTFIPVGYNPALQRAVQEEHERAPDWYRLNYGITTPATEDDAGLEAFHAIGANQVTNIPQSVRHLAVTCGSANSCTSILYGIALTRPPNLETVTLFGIGPTRLDWFRDRLSRIERRTGIAINSLFTRDYRHHPDMSGGDGPYLLRHYDLHATRFSSYQDKMPFSVDEIVFHPTYEGKAFSYMDRHREEFDWWWGAREDAAFWIVGSDPDPNLVLRCLS